MSEELWGVWAWNTGRSDWGFWRHVDGGLDLRTTEAEARRLAAHYSHPTSFNSGWCYEARPWRNVSKARCLACGHNWESHVTGHQCAGATYDK